MFVFRSGIMKKLFLILITLLFASCTAKSPSGDFPISAETAYLTPQVFYQSCGTGESISKTITTDDINYIMSIPPDNLHALLGINIESSSDPSWRYYASCDYLELSLIYHGDGYYKYHKIPKPEVPIDYILIENFDFRGLNEDSDFNDVINVLGDTEIQEGYLDGTEIYFLQYTLNNLIIEFHGGNDINAVTWGVYLKISPSDRK